MPDLDSTIVEDVSQRLSNYLASQPGYQLISHLSSGGSAAIFKVHCPDGIRAIKVYDPQLLAGPRGEAERRRLGLQRGLIGHDCDHLVRLYRVEEAEGTAFIEMDFIEWPSLSKVLTAIPDESIHSLIQQLVVAVRYLESKEIVHRDIKPENIHVAPDFSRLLLLDLGVAREFELVEEEATAATDHGAQRPFIATAQYSSPEYLFRLDQPSPQLWKGLSLYQVGAVLHDMILRKPLFSSEVNLGNRWLVARAILTKHPSFDEPNKQRLLSLKSLASKCLTKDLSVRLSLVDWDAFFDEKKDPLARLATFLKQKLSGSSTTSTEADATKLRFDRNKCVERIRKIVRERLIEACEKQLPSVFSQHTASGFDISFNPEKRACIRFAVQAIWQDGLNRNDAHIFLSGVLVGDADKVPDDAIRHPVGVINTSGSTEAILAQDLSDQIASCLQSGLELIQTTTNIETLFGTDLLRGK